MVRQPSQPFSPSGATGTLPLSSGMEERRSPAEAALPSSNQEVGKKNSKEKSAESGHFSKQLQQPNLKDPWDRREVHPREFSDGQ